MSEEFNTMHWSALKKLVEGKGGVYVGKEQAISFLSGAQPAVSGAPEAPAETPETPGPVTADPNAEAVFDKSKPYGDVCGEIEGMPSARYFQDGHYFNPQGKQVG